MEPQKESLVSTSGRTTFDCRVARLSRAVRSGLETRTTAQQSQVGGPLDTTATPGTDVSRSLKHTRKNTYVSDEDSSEASPQTMSRNALASSLKRQPDAKI